MDSGETINAVLNLMTAGAIAYSVRTTKRLLEQLQKHRDEVESD